MSEHSRVDRAGVQAYERYWSEQLADPEFRAIYAEESAKKEFWLQLVEARQSAGLTQSELARRLHVPAAEIERIEAGAYDDYPLATLRHYVEALGGEFTLVVSVLPTRAAADSPAHG